MERGTDGCRTDGRSDERKNTVPLIMRGSHVASLVKCRPVVSAERA